MKHCTLGPEDALPLRLLSPGGDAEVWQYQNGQWMAGLGVLLLIAGKRKRAKKAAKVQKGQEEPAPK